MVGGAFIAEDEELKLEDRVEFQDQLLRIFSLKLFSALWMWTEISCTHDDQTRANLQTWTHYFRRVFVTLAQTVFIVQHGRSTGLYAGSDAVRLSPRFQFYSDISVCDPPDPSLAFINRYVLW
jgi:hypothetical protein